MQCKVCDVVFPVADFKACLYHPDNSTKIFRNGKVEMTFKCCGQLRKKFESIESSEGCQFKDHEVIFASRRDGENVILCSEALYNELINMIDVVCLPKVPISTITYSYSLNYDIYTHSLPQNKVGTPKKDNQNKHIVINRADDSTINQLEDLDERKVMTIFVQTKGRTTAKIQPHLTWNNEFPVQLNQDIQRENDIKRMNDMVEGLNIKPKDQDDTEGGLFHILESRLKAEINSKDSLKLNK